MAFSGGERRGLYTNNRLMHLIFIALLSGMSYCFIELALLLLAWVFPSLKPFTRFKSLDLFSGIIILISIIGGIYWEYKWYYHKLENNKYLDPELEKLDAIQQSLEQQKQNAQQPKVIEKVVVREVVKVPCKYCGTLIEVSETKCPSCGAPFSR